MVGGRRCRAGQMDLGHHRDRLEQGGLALRPGGVAWEAVLGSGGRGPMAVKSQQGAAGRERRESGRTEGRMQVQTEEQGREELRDGAEKQGRDGGPGFRREGVPQGQEG